jgi:hypothetical protein
MIFRGVADRDASSRKEVSDWAAADTIKHVGAIHKKMAPFKYSKTEVGFEARSLCLGTRLEDWS